MKSIHPGVFSQTTIVVVTAVVVMMVESKSIYNTCYVDDNVVHPGHIYLYYVCIFHRHIFLIQNSEVFSRTDFTFES